MTLRTHDPATQAIWPTSNNVVVRRDPAKEQLTKSGLLLSATPEKPHRGTVVAAGPGWVTTGGQLVGTRVAPGDVVIWSKLVEGAVVDVDTGSGTEELLVISEDVIVAVVNPNPRASNPEDEVTS